MTGGEVIYRAINDSLNFEFNKQKHADDVRLRQEQIDTQKYNAETNRMNVNYNYEINKARNALEARRVSQLELTNAMQGNSWDNAQQMQNLKQQMIEQQQQMLEQQQRAIESVLNTSSMAQAVKHLALGDYDSANRIINSNPILKQKLIKNFGVTRVEGINFNSQEDLDALKQLGVDVNNLTPEAKKSLQSQVFKSYTPDGKIQLHGINELIKETNVLRHMTTEDANIVTQALNKAKTITNPQAQTTPIDDITEGDIASMAKIISDNEKLPYDKVYNDLADLVTVGGITNKEELINSYAMSPETKNLLLSQVTPQDPNQVKTQLDIQSKQLDVLNKQQKLKTSMLEDQQKVDDYVAKQVATQHADELLSDAKIWKTDKYDPNVAKLLDKLQGKNKLPASLAEKITRRIAITKKGKELLPKLEQALKDTDFREQAKLMIADYVKGMLKSDKDLQKYKTAHQDALLLLYDYINAVSGQALTDNELKARLEAAGYGKWKSGESIVKGLKTFVNAVGAETQSLLEANKALYPKDIYGLSRDFNKYYHTKINTSTKKPSIDKFFKDSKSTNDNKQTNSNKSTKQINLDDYVTE